MLSRTAENLYWLARYVERAEYLARTIDATLRVTALPAAYIGKTNEWDSALSPPASPRASISNTKKPTSATSSIISRSRRTIHPRSGIASRRRG